MAKDFAKPFYDSDRWKSCRAAYIARRISIDGGVCEECGENLGYIVHHKTHLTAINISDPDVSLSWSNLAYVCLACHNRIHGVGCEAEKEYAFDALGNCIPNVNK